jgi:hypothetical protein
MSAAQVGYKIVLQRDGIKIVTKIKELNTLIRLK